jgi:hypothetical protein
MAERIRIDHGSFESGKKKIARWKIPAIVKVELHRFLDDLGLGKLRCDPQVFAASRPMRP